jgi:hypothetical protein
VSIGQSGHHSCRSPLLPTGRNPCSEEVRLQLLHLATPRPSRVVPPRRNAASRHAGADSPVPPPRPPLAPSSHGPKPALRRGPPATAPASDALSFIDLAAAPKRSLAAAVTDPPAPRLAFRPRRARCRAEARHRVRRRRPTGLAAPAASRAPAPGPKSVCRDPLRCRAARRPAGSPWSRERAEARSRRPVRASWPVRPPRPPLASPFPGPKPVFRRGSPRPLHPVTSRRWPAPCRTEVQPDIRLRTARRSHDPALPHPTRRRCRSTRARARSGRLSVQRRARLASVCSSAPKRVFTPGVWPARQPRDPGPPSSVRRSGRSPLAAQSVVTRSPG